MVKVKRAEAIKFIVLDKQSGVYDYLAPEGAHQMFIEFELCAVRKYWFRQHFQRRQDVCLFIALMLLCRCCALVFMYANTTDLFMHNFLARTIQFTRTLHVKIILLSIVNTEQVDDEDVITMNVDAQEAIFETTFIIKFISALRGAKHFIVLPRKFLWLNR